MKPNCSGFAKKKNFPIKASPPHPYQSRRLRSPPCQPHSLHRSPGKHPGERNRPLGIFRNQQEPKQRNDISASNKETKHKSKTKLLLHSLPLFSDFSFTEPVLEDCSVVSRPAAPAAHSTWHGLLPPFMLAHDLRVQLQEFQARLHPRTP